MSETKTIWVTGSKGFIGSELVNRLEKHGYRVVGTDSELSVCEPERLDAFANEIRPDIIINCAGIPRAATGISNRIKATRSQCPWRTKCRRCSKLRQCFDGANFYRRRIPCQNGGAR